MSTVKSTPIQQIPVDMSNDFKEEDESINQVLEEIEKQNVTTEKFMQPLNNNIPPIYNNNMQQQQTQFPNQAQFNNPQLQMNNMPIQQQQGINTKLTQEEIDRFLAQNGVNSSPWSFSNIYNTFTSEIKLLLSLIVIVLLLQNSKFNLMVESNMSFVKIPYIDIIVKAIICMIIIIVSRNAF
jgi:hypothetical protein